MGRLSAERWTPHYTRIIIIFWMWHNGNV